MSSNPFILAIIPALFLGFLNGYYWGTKGYRGWHLYYLGSIVAYVAILKFIQFLLK